MGTIVDTSKFVYYNRMGKKKQAVSGLGKQLMKDRFGTHQKTSESFLHTSELNDGFAWQKYNAQSVTEESNLEAFLNTAQLAGKEFTAERLNASIVSAEKSTGLLSPEEILTVRSAQEENKVLLRIPRRPAWDEETSASELDRREKDAFLEWRRQLHVLEEKEHILMTPFERNIEFWRQLWRVIERSDVIVQIVDARNPLMFRSADLDTYVKEVGNEKMTMVLVNKADYLTEQQRELWASYFDSIGVRVAFWSALEESLRIDETEAEEGIENEEHGTSEEEEDSENEEEEEEASMDVNTFDVLQEDSEDRTEPDNDLAALRLSENIIECNCDVNPVSSSTPNIPADSSNILPETSHQNNRCASDNSSIVHPSEQPPNFNIISNDVDLVDQVQNQNNNKACSRKSSHTHNTSRLLGGEELVNLWKSMHSGKKTTEGITTIGLVGYPNVGKSSTINAVLRCKKVPVSATPGRTKHFQTLHVDESLLLCDCPGLVMPSFVSTKAEMILNGVLPVDQMRDYVPATALLCQLISRAVLESTYGIMLPKPGEGEPPDRPPTAHELLHTYGLMRGFMSHKGIPDYHRSSRCILKDFVKGVLLYCNAPPGVNDDVFMPCAPPQKQLKLKEEPTMQKMPKGAKVKNKYSNAVDEQFFSQMGSRIGSKGVHGRSDYIRQAGFGHGSHLGSGDVSAGSSLHSSMESGIAGKPWKRHCNRGKKEKLRRKHAQLDVL